MKLRSLVRSAALVSAIALIPATTAGFAQVDGRAGPEFAKLFAVYQRIKASYVEPVDDDKLIRGAIDGMLASLDPHSSYLDGGDLQRLETMIDGNYSGLGLSVVMDDGAVKVVSPFKGSPADKMGIKAGDYITHLDGKLIYGGELDDAVAKMRGPAGSSHPPDHLPHRARRAVRRHRHPRGDRPRTGDSRTQGGEHRLHLGQRIQPQRRRERVQGVERHEAAGGGADERPRARPAAEPRRLARRGDRAVSDLFLDKGVIVSQRGRASDESASYAAESVFKGDMAKGVPVIVLIDAGSASASEIVAGALQDQRRAVVMGERSFGKGSVQTLIPLGQTAALKLTTARYYTPSGHSVQEGGIEPDIEVPQMSDPDLAKREKFRMRESDLRGHLVNEAALKDEELEKDRKDDPRFHLTAEQLKNEGVEDFQLDYALRTLRRTAPSAVARRN